MKVIDGSERLIEYRKVLKLEIAVVNGKVSSFLSFLFFYLLSFRA